MDTNMFCFQCEQTAGCSGCTGKAGVCGKSAQTAQIQDQLTGALIGLAHAANGTLPEGQPIEKVMIESLFAFSIFTTVIILLVSLYVTNSKTNIKVNQEYETYQSEKQQIEYTLNLDEGIETCLKKALH